MSAKQRHYEYRFINRNQKSAFDGDLMRVEKEINLERMSKSLKYLEGEHNFKSFTKTNEEITDYVRKISQTSLIRDNKNLDEITLSFVGTGFMRYMVRNMVGAMIDVARGNKDIEYVKNALEGKDNISIYTAPACGLYLESVEY